MCYSVSALPFAYAGPLAQADFKIKPEDFRVDEHLSFPLTGEGDQLYIQIEKMNANTNYVADKIRKILDMKPVDLGLAGLKDRHAVTTQWFSLKIKPEKIPLIENYADEDFKVIQAVKHAKKLKRGAIAKNDFQIILKNIHGQDDCLQQKIDQQLEKMKNQGIPNYFAEQRFGHDGNNIVMGKKVLLQRMKCSKAKRSIYLSAVRSFLFNKILANRVTSGNWNQLLPGERVQLQGSKKTFLSEYDAETKQRMLEFDIHPTAALVGEGFPSCTAEAAELEQQILQEELEIIEAFNQARFAEDRRATRVMVDSLQWQWQADDQLLLKFSLPSGVYATAVLRECFILN